MYFSFTNVSVTFQLMINYIFEDLILKRQVIVYLDNILIFENDKKEYKTIILEVLLRLLNNDLFAKAEKYFFLRKSINYLEMIIFKGHVSIDKKKISEVLKWPMPIKVKHVQAFLNFANFYQIYQGFCKDSNTTHNINKERYFMEIEPRTNCSI